MTPPLPTDGREAALRLSAADPILGAIISRVGPCIVVPIPRVDLFQALLRSIIYQQLHAKAAAAIHARVLALMPRANAANFQSLSDEALRSAGLSANKLLAVRDLASQTLEGTIPKPAATARLSDDELISRLTSVRGIVPWTVHMLMIFYLGRPDVLPTGDFAIRKAFSLHYRRGRAAKPASIERHARLWRPHRSVASWYLWRSLDPVLITN